MRGLLVTVLLVVALLCVGNLVLGQEAASETQAQAPVVKPVGIPPEPPSIQVRIVGKMQYVAREGEKDHVFVNTLGKKFQLDITQLRALPLPGMTNLSEGHEKYVLVMGMLNMDTDPMLVAPANMIFAKEIPPPPPEPKPVE